MDSAAKRSFYIKITFLFSAALIAFLLINMGQVILPFIFAALLAYFLQPLADFLLKHKIPLILTVLFVYLLFAVLLYIVIAKGLPLLTGELTKIVSDIPTYLAKVEKLLQTFGISQNMLAEFAEKILQDAGKINTESLTASLKSAAQFLFALLLAPLLSYYILKDREKMKRGIISVLPIDERDEISRIAGDINRIYRSFFSGYVLLGIIVFVLSFVLYSFLKLPYAILLALLLGICDLIPYFGPLIGAIPAVLLAFMQSPAKALYVVLGIIIIQQLESAVFSPKILGSRIGIHPLTVIFAVLFGGFYFGLFGLIFAVPTAATLKLLVSYIYCRISRAKA